MNSRLLKILSREKFERILKSEKKHPKLSFPQVVSAVPEQLKSVEKAMEDLVRLNSKFRSQLDPANYGPPVEDAKRALSLALKREFLPLQDAAVFYHTHAVNTLPKGISVVRETYKEKENEFRKDINEYQQAQKEYLKARQGNSQDREYDLKAMENNLKRMQKALKPKQKSLLYWQSELKAREAAEKLGDKLNEAAGYFDSMLKTVNKHPSFAQSLPLSGGYAIKRDLKYIKNMCDIDNKLNGKAHTKEEKREMKAEEKSIKRERDRRATSRMDSYS